MPTEIMVPSATWVAIKEIRVGKILANKLSKKAAKENSSNIIKIQVIERKKMAFKLLPLS